MTPTIELLRSHRSIRHFTDAPVSDEQRAEIIASAQAASTSSFLQCTSIIRITDPALRERLVPLTGGQQHVAQAAEFWVFCADFNRHLQICPQAQLGLAEQLLIGVVDTALLAQNALTAAESLGLGGVYIGGCATALRPSQSCWSCRSTSCRCSVFALAGRRITRTSSRGCRRPCWCMRTAISRWITRCWRSMTNSWRTIICRAAATPAAIPGATISGALS